MQPKDRVIFTSMIIVSGRDEFGFKGTLCPPDNVFYWKNIPCSVSKKKRCSQNNVVRYVFSPRKELLFKSRFDFKRALCPYEKVSVLLTLFPRPYSYITREIGMCLCGDNHCHVYTSNEGRKLWSPRHFKMRNGLCRLLFSTKQMLPCHT